MYSGTFETICEFAPNDLVILGQNIRSIRWGTVESACCDKMENVIKALPEEPVKYDHAQFMRFLSANLTAPLSLCSLTIKTDHSTLTFSLYEEKTLRFTFESGESFLYQLGISPSPTYRLPPDTILEAIDAGLFLLPATTPEELEKQLLKIELFGNGILTPVSG